MTLSEMINRLKLNCAIEIRDFENIMICKTGSDRKGITPYLNYDVVSWFPKSIDEFCVLIDDREDLYNGEIK